MRRWPSSASQSSSFLLPQPQRWLDRPHLEQSSMPSQRAPVAFSEALLSWQAEHGRSGLPWQNTRDPYRVWLSEIMLQQTQVSTVKAYYAAFLARFPAVSDLAAANQDEVLALWAGLGYYSRARNLHACAKAVVSVHGGEFPRSATALQTLPGIGPSTAAAIASFCFDERVAILDGNVKRVITRVLGFEHDLASSRNEKILWQLATDLLPGKSQSKQMPRYTQAIMDLGATVCTPRQPTCLTCPMAERCVARRLGKPEAFPVKTKKLKRSSEALWLLWARRSDGAVLLQKRPTPGVWAGLYCLPLFDSVEALEAVLKPREKAALVAMAPFVHVLTHKDLHLHVMVWDNASERFAPDLGEWVADLGKVGLPAPVKKLLLNS
jgi:A/G-specific adenine glycosylase